LFRQELFKRFHTFIKVLEILNTVESLDEGVALTLTLPEFMSASNVARESDVVFIVPNSDRKTFVPSCTRFNVVI